MDLSFLVYFPLSNFKPLSYFGIRYVFLAVKALKLYSSLTVYTNKNTFSSQIQCVL